jgi:hypothetical protein
MVDRKILVGVSANSRPRLSGVGQLSPCKLAGIFLVAALELAEVPVGQLSPHSCLASLDRVQSID